MTQTPGADTGSAVALWWRNANNGTRARARAADYYATSPLTPDLVATLARAGVAITDAHLVPPQGGRRGYYLDRATSEALRALDAPGER